MADDERKTEGLRVMVAPSLMKRLRAAAKLNERTMGFIVRKAIEAYLPKIEGGKKG